MVVTWWIVFVSLSSVLQYFSFCSLQTKNLYHISLSAPPFRMFIFLKYTTTSPCVQHVSTHVLPTVVTVCEMSFSSPICPYWPTLICISMFPSFPHTSVTKISSPISVPWVSTFCHLQHQPCAHYYNSLLTLPYKCLHWQTLCNRNWLTINAWAAP